ncbi:Tannase/feruloyl esterase [Poronia punctata]|nr:Tannase/feruloyl esterase [Poronia punctata]
MAILWAIITLCAWLVAVASWPLLPGESRCSTSYFEAVLPAGADIQRVQHVTTGSFVEQGNIGYPTSPTNLPPLCAVIVQNTTADYRFGMFLPDKWGSAHRFLAIGSYGFLGGINWLDMGVGVRYDAATLSTDTGHSSGAGDITWANTRLKQVNWAYAAQEGSIALGKVLTERYYGEKIARAYFSGCSTGGREALRLIQRDPDVFDGALVGAPAWDTKHLMPWLSQLAVWNLPEAADYSIGDVTLLERLQKEVLRQCDALDGVVDNVVSAPGKCRDAFDISRVRCDVNNNETGCWTAAQVGTAVRIYADYVSSDGRLVYKGAEYGSELDWATYLLPAVESQSKGSDAQSNVRRNFDGQYERYFMDYGKGWETTSYNDSVVRDAEAWDEAVVGATADNFGDLAAFRDRGGKIVMYAGLADNVVPVQHTTLYYDRTIEAIGRGDRGIDDFLRYFQIPGMRHCWGTPDNVKAPWIMGGAGQAVQRPPYASAWSVPLGYDDVRHDALLALMDWVENGREVSQLIASEFNFTDITKQKMVLYRQRPLCPYPKTAQWSGRGDQNAAVNWRCG